MIQEFLERFLKNKAELKSIEAGQAIASKSPPEIGGMAGHELKRLHEIKFVGYGLWQWHCDKPMMVFKVYYKDKNRSDIIRPSYYIYVCSHIDCTCRDDSVLRYPIH